MKFPDAPTPQEYLDWVIVFATGWTLEQVRSLSVQDYDDFFKIRDGRQKAGIST